jgi:subtilisin family serine protease
VTRRTDVTQATTAVLDGTNWVNGSTAAVARSADHAVLDDPEQAAFGHGTMVAGLVHLTAPTAKIMPVKAFSRDGTAYTSDILRAIYYSVNKGAKVLNMSFSRPTPSLEMKIALDYAPCAAPSRSPPPATRARRSCAIRPRTTT